MIEPGRVCMKIAGREAGKYCVILEKINDSFVLVTGPKSVTKVKRRKCNVNHIEPTQEKLEIKEKATDDEVEKAWKVSGLIEKLNIQPIRTKVTTTSKR